jgi:Ca2+-binding RTX toxin-like protein
MAVITAQIASNLAPLNLYPFIAGATSVLWQNDIGFTSPRGTTYADIVRFERSGAYFDLAGPSITVGSGGVVTGGTVTGMFSYVADGTGGFTPALAIEGISVSAVAVYNAGLSASTADDLALWTSALAGADLFDLSPGSDSAHGHAGNDTMRGHGGSDTLTGGLGDDSLDGGALMDLMVGGPGNDTYVVDFILDAPIEAVGEGLDTVRSSVTATLTANVERLVLTGTAAINGFGNPLANSLTGNTANNSFLGGAGNDTIVGGAGNDTLHGETGDDSMSGGTGNDLYYVDSTGDRSIEMPAAGVDTVRSMVTRTLGNNLEHLILEGNAQIHGTGNGLANTLTGNSSWNRLNGLAGNDTLIGFLGNDTLTGGDGLDAFRFLTRGNPSGNLVTVTDFVSADDRLQLDNGAIGYTAVGPNGALAAAAFRLGSAAADASDRIIYHRASGAMYYDSDGSGAVAKVQFAQFAPGTLVTLGDLWII